MNEYKKNILSIFIDEGCIPLDYSHDHETVGYVNASKTIKEIYDRYGKYNFSKFEALLNIELDTLNNLEILSYRLQGKKSAYEDVINEIKRLNILEVGIN